MKNKVSIEPLGFIRTPGVCLLWQESQYIGDGPFLVGAVLNGQMECRLGPFACHQLQTMLRVNVLDRTTL